MNLTHLIPATAGGVALVACVTDLRSATIPNWLSLGALGAGLVLQGLSSGVWGLGVALVGALVCGLVPLFLFWRGGLGGGDVKLLAALGALLGARTGLQVQLWAMLLMSAYAIVVLAWRGHLIATLRRAARLVLRGFKLDDRQPTDLVQMRFGGAIFAAVAFSLLDHFGGVRMLALKVL